MPFIAHRKGKSGNSDRFYLLGLQNNCRWWLQPWNSKMLAPWKESYDKPRQLTKKQRHRFADQSCGFSRNHVWIWELDHEEGWAPKNWCFWMVVLEKTLWESFGLQRGSNQWILKENLEHSLAGLMMKLKPLDGKIQLIGKEPDPGKDWR